PYAPPHSPPPSFPTRRSSDLTAAAHRKILTLPPAAAFCSEELYTFSNTRGTERMKVGRKVAMTSSRVAVSGTCPMGTPAQMVSTDRKSTRLNSSHVSISYAVF